MNGTKYNCHLDFKKLKSLEKLYALIDETGVVIEGYRPYHLDKCRLEKENLPAAAKKRGCGIVYIRENRCGWNCSWAGNKSLMLAVVCLGNLDKPLVWTSQFTPVLLNNDFCTGTTGATAVIEALIEKSQKRGSYVNGCVLNLLFYVADRQDWYLF